MPSEAWAPEPEEIRGQGKGNKQVGNGEMSKAEQELAIDAVHDAYKYSRQGYLTLLEAGVCREQARTVLPMGQYTEAYVTANLGDWLLFLKARLNPHAQKEIREYAEVIFAMFQDLFPVTMEAFLDYQANGVKLSAQELRTIQHWLDQSQINGYELEDPDCTDYDGVNLHNLRDSQRQGWLSMHLPTKRERLEFWKKINGRKHHEPN
jgi:thymidylate synthase (FAD)